MSAKNKRWWASTDQERVREIYRKQATKKRQSGQYRVRARITHGIYMSLRGEKAGKSAYSLLPYTRAELVAHLERQFLRGMTWGNYGDWHIDHIVPLSSFTITGPDDPELCRAWALPNLRPLWAADNIRKKDKRETLL